MSVEMSSEQPEKRWYVVQVYSTYEQFVKQELERRIAHEDLHDYFEEIMIPTEEVVEMRSGHTRKTESKFFPGYVLIRMVMNEQTWHMVHNTPRVVRFIGGTSDKPAPIPDSEAHAILQRIEENVDKPRPKTLFEPGEVVRVKEGPFVDFNGVVEEVNYDKSRLRVAVLIFGRSTPVELEFAQVEKV